MAGEESADRPTPRTPLPPRQIGQPGDEVCQLGAALTQRVPDVLERTGVRIRALGHGSDAQIQRDFEAINRNSTMAIARWLSGEGLEAIGDAGQRVGQFYSDLAASRAAPLQEISERWLSWRDAIAEVIRECAEELDVPAKATLEALSVVQVALELSVVRMCETFDRERQRTDEELAASKEELAFVATHDELTGLPNRMLIVDRIGQMLARSARTGTPVAAMSIDIDNFKSVNDTLGRLAGDELLRAVARRLEGVLRGSDALGRLAGNEFVAICEGSSLDAGPELIAERLLEALKPAFVLSASDNTTVGVTASVGIALGARSSAEDLLRDANAAMYIAKRDGRNRFSIYETQLWDTIRQRAELEMGLRHALERDELFVLYQPVFDLHDLRVAALETLIRWRNPSRGLIAPNDFIPLAEETGLITEIGAWVLRRACTQGAAWQRAGYPVRVAVNVSARQLDDDQLLVDIDAALRDSGLDPGALILEITETALMRNVDETVERLRAIKVLGPRVAIDDFGTGYSSLAHLQRFPVDELKIDRSFVSRLGENRDARAFLHTLVALGKTLSVETVAEGIENDLELADVTAEGCEYGQGFLFARPLDVADAEAMLLEGAAALPGSVFRDPAQQQEADDQSA